MAGDRFTRQGSRRLFGERARARRGRRRLIKRSVFGPFGPLGALGPFGVFGPLSPIGPLRRRGVWKYVVAAGVARATVAAAARRLDGRDGRDARPRVWAARAWARGLDAWQGEEDARPARARRRRAWSAWSRQDAPAQNGQDQDMEMEEDTMPRFGRGGFPGFEKPQGGGNGRRFDRGDVKYVLLDLLREGPRHGYDMIKELEKRSGGMYSPSPGSVYPTLQMLEDQGFVTSTTVEGKRTYRLTDAGYAFIEDRPERTDDARGRAWAESEGGEGIRDELRSVGREAGELARSLRDAVRSYAPDSRQVNEIRDVLGDTRKRIESILAERREAMHDDDRNKPTTV